MQGLEAVKGANIKLIRNCSLRRQHAQHCSQIFTKIASGPSFLRNPGVGLTRIHNQAAGNKYFHVARTISVTSERHALGRIFASLVLLENGKMEGRPVSGYQEPSSGLVGHASDFEAEEPASADPSTSGKGDAPQKQSPLFRFGVITGKSKIEFSGYKASLLPPLKDFSYCLYLCILLCLALLKQLMST
jgi:hypothetical protein